MVCIYLILSSEPTSFHFLINRQFYFLELQLINSREATVLLSFVFKDSLQQHCLLRNMIIECHVRPKFVIARRKSQSNCYFKFLPAISLFCPLSHFFARCFNKNSKATNQSDLRNNAQHVIMHEIVLVLPYIFCNCPLFVIALVPGLFSGGKPDKTCCHPVVASKWLKLESVSLLCRTKVLQLKHRQRLLRVWQFNL